MFSTQYIKDLLKDVGYTNVAIVYATDYEKIMIDENELPSNSMTLVFVGHVDIEKYGTPEPFIVNDVAHSIVKTEKITYIGVYWNRLGNVRNFNVVMDNNFSNDDILKLFIAEEELEKIKAEQFKRNLVKMLTESADSILNRKEEEYERAIRDKEDAVRKAVTYAEKAARLHNEIINFNLSKEIEEKVVKEFELIRNHKNTKKVEVNDGRIQIFTDTLYINEPIDGKRYLLGEMQVDYDPINGNVNIFNETPDNRRYSYWGSGCHHPHVSQEGRPCLGTADAQIAQYTMEREYYAAYLTILAFMRTVNINDVAGAYVRSWDEVDENGNAIKEGEDNVDRCPCCDEEYNVDNGIYVECCDEDVCGDCAHHTWDDNYCCDRCIDNGHYVLCEDCNDYVSIDDAHYIDGEYYCPNCAENHEEEGESDD